MDSNEKKTYFEELKNTKEFSKFINTIHGESFADLITDNQPFNAYLFHKKLFDVENNMFVLMKHPHDIYTVLHSHDFIEFEYIKSGQIVQYINGSRTLLRGGTLVIFNKNVVHSVEKSTAADEMYHIFINEKFFDIKFFGLTPEDNIFSNFLYKSLYLDKKYNDYLIVEELSSDILRIIDDILLESDNKGKNSTRILYSYMTILFMKLISNDLTESKLSKHKDNNKKKLVNDLLTYLQNNYQDATMSAAASALNLHPNYFSKLVKELTGQNFSDILCQIRMDIAAQILLSTDETIDNVAAKVGYSNANHFHKLFKNYHGLTPGEYRDNYHKTVRSDDQIIKINNQ